MKYHKIIELNKSDKVYLVTNIINNQIIDTPEIVEFNVFDILPNTETYNKLCETYKEIILYLKKQTIQFTSF